MATDKIKIEQNKGSIYLKPLLFIGLLILLIAGLFYYISRFLLPNTESLENPKYEIASEVISSDQKVLGKIFTVNREWLEYKEINPIIIDALVSTEDERFFDHTGIDYRGLARAIVFMGSKGGASTITQQLAKQFFTVRARSFPKRVWQKLKEWIIAIEFEKRYTKEEILAMYLNKSDFLFDAVGIGAAAKTYFGKDQKKLNVEEAAVLIAMLKNPRIYNPRIYPQNCMNRRSVVLKQMVKNGKLTEEEYQNKRVKVISLDLFSREDYSKGLAPYFRAELTKWLRELLNQDQYRKPDGTKYSLYNDGLKIYTTVDSRIQKYAEEALYDHMSQLQNRYFDRWKGKDITSFGFDKAQTEKNKAVLVLMMKESPRYQTIRQSLLSNILAEIKENQNNFSPSDTDIFRLFEAAKNKNHLEKLKKEGTITDVTFDQYSQLLESDEWPTLKKQWEQMQKAVQRAFNTPTKMKVFAYNENMEKEVVMTPMDSIKYHLQHLQLGSVSVHPKTGHVLAWVGGVSHKYFKFDHVNSRRQVGSTFKPFVYSTAIIENAISPCFKVQDVKQCIQANDPNFNLSSTWCPSNSDNKFTGESLTLRQALRDSKNSISVYLMKEIGNVNSVKNLLGNLGIDKSRIPDYPSICLGTPELSAMEMAQSYTAFANEGIVTKPFFVTRIEDKNGKVIFTAMPDQKKAINPSYNYAIVDMLRYVTSNIQGKFSSQIAGKTGTTNSYRDGWFVGFTPEIIISTWVGGDQEFIRFNSLSDGQGAVMARPFFERLLMKIEKDNTLGFGKHQIFMRPEEDLVEIDCSKYEGSTQKSDQNKKNTEFDEEF